MRFVGHEFLGREVVCAAVLKIDLNNKPRSVQKQAYESKVLKTIKWEVSESIQKYAESLSMMQNSSQFLFSCAQLDQNLECWSIQIRLMSLSKLAHLDS